MKLLKSTVLWMAAIGFATAFTACEEEDVTSTLKAYNITNITPTGGDLRVTCTVEGDDMIDAGVIVSTSATYPKLNNYSYLYSFTDGTGSMNDFKLTFTGLSPDTIYRYRIYVRTASDSVIYGASVYSFRPAILNIPLCDVPGGTFQMGGTAEQDTFTQENELPVHTVTLSPYQIGKYEVTNAQYVQFLNSRRVGTGKTAVTYDGTSQTYFYTSSHKFGIFYNDSTGSWDVYYGYENHPVVNVTWYGANEYCLWAGGHLPTEAQWEFAARGGTASSSFLYSGSNDAGSVAWYYANTFDKAPLKFYSQPVGGKAPNTLGIYDMTGNVYEWVADWYSAYFSWPQTDPTGMGDADAAESKMERKVLRGGCWADELQSSLRITRRLAHPPTSNMGSVGFRFAK